MIDGAGEEKRGSVRSVGELLRQDGSGRRERGREGRGKEERGREGNGKGENGNEARGSSKDGRGEGVIDTGIIGSIRSGGGRV